MRTRSSRLLPCILAAVLAVMAVPAPTARAQYYDAQVLQKSFEKTDFFFRPGYLNPYGLGSFGRSAAGFLREALVDLQLSPSRLAADTTMRESIYLDFRSTTRRETEAVWPLYRYGAVAEPGMGVADRMSYPSWYRESRRLPEPVVAAALFLRPVPGALPGLTVGLTYQAIIDDQGYYSIPHDVYKGAVGVDYAGERMTSDAYQIVDVYAGSDDMHQVGHFPAFYAGYDTGGPWRFGLRAELARFDRTGESGNTSRTPASPGQLPSIWSHVEERDQRYDHVDLVLGAEVDLDETTIAGVSAGWLDGSARQDLVRRDTSFWGQGASIPTEPGYWTRNTQGGETASDWSEDGSAVHGTAFLRRTLGGSRILTATYGVRRESVDLGAGSVVRDSSEYRSIGMDDRTRWENENWSRVSDVRSGSGQRTGTAHRASLAMEWAVSGDSRLHVGANVEIERSNTETTESVDAYRSRFYRYVYEGRTEAFSERIVEDKTLQWTFSTRRTAVRIPILFTHRFSDVVEVMAGITREMTAWRIEDETLALFDLRETTTNGLLERRTAFGERYREPTEQRTDVDTDILIGVTVTPAERFDVRLLAMPTWHGSTGSTDLETRRWWLSFTFRP